jgi:aspartate racemase
MQKIGLLATTGTIQGGRFQKKLGDTGRETISPGPDDQLLVMSAIYDIKDARCGRTRKEISLEVRGVAGRLQDRGAQGIIAACTEIPLVLRPGDLPVPVFDPLILLARAAITAAGRDPIEA